MNFMTIEYLSESIAYRYGALWFPDVICVRAYAVFDMGLGLFSAFVSEWRGRRCEFPKLAFYASVSSFLTPGRP